LKGIVVFESKYGNTRRVAEKIVEGIKNIKNIDFDFKTPREVKPEELAEYDVILFGSPNHFGDATRGLRKFIKKLGGVNLQGKKCTFFDTYMIELNRMKAVESMRKIVEEKVSGMIVIDEGLSIKVKGLKGPLEEGWDKKSFEFGEKIASKI